MARPPIYTCDEHFFDNIDTDAKAYILGFIYADGHVNRRCGLTITLQKTDHSVLTFIQQQLKTDSPLRLKVNKKTQREYIQFGINRQILNKALENLGIRSNKSNNNAIWPKIDDMMVPAFLRGLFDGDGSIWRKFKSSWACGFTGGLGFLQLIEKELIKHEISNNPIRFRYGKHRPQACQLEITHKNNIIKFFNYIYKDSTFHLSRKYEKFIAAQNDFKIWENENVVINDKRASYILERYNNKVKQKTIASELNIGYSTIRNFIQRMRKRNKCI